MGACSFNCRSETGFDLICPACTMAHRVLEASLSSWYFTVGQTALRISSLIFMSSSSKGAKESICVLTAS